MKDIYQIILYALGVITMFALIPLITNDYILAAVCCVFIVVALALRKERLDYIFLTLGFLGLILGEYFFVRTGVENFNRTTFLGVMPLWLPFFWAFIFLSMKRTFWILVKDHWHTQLK